MHAGNTPTIWLDQPYPTELRRRWTTLQHVALALALRCDLPPIRALDRLYRWRLGAYVPVQRKLETGDDLMRVGEQCPVVSTGDDVSQVNYVIINMVDCVELFYPCRALYAISDRLDALQLITYQTLMRYAGR